MMNRKMVAVWISLSMVFGFIVILIEIAPVVKAPSIIYVDDSGGADYIKIQDAIDAANPGDTIRVYDGIYYEHVSLTKTLSLIGNGSALTIIDGSNSGSVINVQADWCNISMFKIINSGSDLGDDAISVYSNNNYINRCNCSNNEGGVHIYNDMHNNTVSNSTFYDNVWTGVICYFSNYNTIINCTASGNFVGFGLTRTMRTYISNCTSIRNSRSGFTSSDSKQVVIENCTSLYHDEYGFVVFSVSSSQNVVVSNCTAKFNKKYGIILDTNAELNETIIIDNTIENNEIHGIYLVDAHKNTIENNVIRNNKNFGIYIESGISNSIYHNIFHNNTNGSIQARDDESQNTWDNGYPLGGNYWSDYNGSDFYSGPNQDINGSDGIGDTPYVIDFDSQDNYPLMEPMGDFSFLREGWNLISIPRIQNNTKLEDVLSQINGSYGAVQFYNASDPNDHWKHYHISKPTHLNDMDSIYHTISFWIYITEPGGVRFEYFGTAPSENQTIQLYKGWNMVGYPSPKSYNRTVGLNNLTFDSDVDCIQWFDAATKTWHFTGQNDYFVPGRGYWIHSKVEATWEVPL